MNERSESETPRQAFRGQVTSNLRRSKNGFTGNFRMRVDFGTNLVVRQVALLLSEHDSTTLTQIEPGRAVAATGHEYSYRQQNGKTRRRIRAEKIEIL